jgi:hypothetical protein
MLSDKTAKIKLKQNRKNEKKEKEHIGRIYVTPFTLGKKFPRLTSKIHQ